MLSAFHEPPETATASTLRTVAAAAQPLSPVAEPVAASTQPIAPSTKQVATPAQPVPSTARQICTVSEPLTIAVRGSDGQERGVPVVPKPFALGLQAVAQPPSGPKSPSEVPELPVPEVKVEDQPRGPAPAHRAREGWCEALRRPLAPRGHQADAAGML